MQRFETSQWLPLPVELVFLFFANPSNLPPLMPDKLQMRIDQMRLQPPPPRPPASDLAEHFTGTVAGKGSEILISFSPSPWLRKRIHWTARITEFEWNSHFCDEQIQGPFASFRHRHGTLPEMRDGSVGTLVTDVIDYALPFGFLGNLGNALVRRQLAHSFAHRQERLPQILGFATRLAAQLMNAEASFPKV
jgi:ligand-binding SRPBCC domain-containing protein